jgi:hypothetical protein
MTSTEGESEQLAPGRGAGAPGQSRRGHAHLPPAVWRSSPRRRYGMAYYQTLYGYQHWKSRRSGRHARDGRSQPRIDLVCRRAGHHADVRPAHRAEGIRILQAHPQDAEAQAALRKALLWDSANPTSAAELRQYLKQHPQDTEVAGNLKDRRTKLAQMKSGIARTPEERAAFAALNAHRLDEAQKPASLRCLKPIRTTAGPQPAWAFCACSKRTLARPSAF